MDSSRKAEKVMAPEKLEPSEKCKQGTCACIPACDTQMKRVDEFLREHRERESAKRRTEK
jgi:tryptophanyl-tRNA synthetase